MQPKIDSLEDARRLGLPRYVSNKPCKRGHYPAVRYTKSKTCVECEKLKRSSIQYREYKKNYRSQPTIVAKIREYEARPEVVSRRKEYAREYRETYKVEKLADTRWRQAAKKQRTPTWANREKIKEFYKLAKSLTEQTGVRHHVDHVIPMIGKFVSGLHVETNLRVVPAKENLSKGNRLIEDLL